MPLPIQNSCALGSDFFDDLLKMAYSHDLPKMAVMDDHGLSKTINDDHGLSWTIMDYH